MQLYCNYMVLALLTLLSEAICVAALLGRSCHCAHAVGLNIVAFVCVCCVCLQVPLVTLVGASNELPESEELDALYDRFLIRKEVKQVTAGGEGSGWRRTGLAQLRTRSAGC